MGSGEVSNLPGGPSGTGYLAIVTVPNVICAAELCLFLGTAGWQSDRRRKYFKQHGSTEHMAEDLGIAVELPVCAYKRSGVYLVLDEQQHEQHTRDI